MGNWFIYATKALKLKNRGPFCMFSLQSNIAKEYLSCFIPGERLWVPKIWLIIFPSGFQIGKAVQDKANEKTVTQLQLSFTTVVSFRADISYAWVLVLQITISVAVKMK